MLSGETATRKLTYEDYLRFPDDGKRHELIDGVHYVTPAPLRPHQSIVGNLYYAIRHHLEQQPGGRVYLSPFGVVFTLFDVVEPDLLFVSEARRPIVTEKHVQGAPDLVVEIISKSTRRRDEGIKLRLYERSAVEEYWVIYPESGTIRIYRRSGPALKLTDERFASRQDVLTTPLLPGLEISVARVFED